MRQLVAEQLERGTGTIVGARTVRGNVIECRLVGNDMVIGIVDVRTDEGRISIRVSADQNDYQRARVYEDDKLVESLLLQKGAVVYVDEETSAT